MFDLSSFTGAIAPKVQAAAQPVPAAQPIPPTPPNPEVIRRALVDADLGFSRMCEERGAPEAFYAFMAPEGICLFSDEPSIQGRDAIKVHLAASQQGILSWKPREAEVGAGADLGYTWGTYELHGANREGEAETTYGKYVIIWKKEPDGSWKANLFSTSPSPTPASRG